MGKSAKVEAYLERVASLGCVLCDHLGRGFTPAQIHHLFDAHQRNDWLVAPLCPSCHQGPNGFHGLGGERGFRARYKLGEPELLAMTIERLS
jgi:hypothetical protein